MRQRLGMALMWAGCVLVACGDGDGGGGDAPEDVATIEIEPNSAMLVASGDAAQLRAVAYDAAGNELDVKVEWSIDDASVFSIDGGKVVALTGEASSTRAHAAVGDVSASSLVYIAKPAPNAVTYSGDQVTRAPEVVGEPEALLGMQVRVGLAGVDVSVGDLLIPVDETTAMGRVVDVSGEMITVEVVPLNELFEELWIDDEETIEITPEQLAGSTALEFEIPPFKCEGETKLTTELVLELTRPMLETFSIKKHFLTHIVSFSTVMATARVEGDFIGAMAGSAEMLAIVAANFECKWLPIRLPVPVDGPAAAVLLPLVPIGPGASMELELQATLAKATAAGRIGAHAVWGFDYDSDNGFRDVVEFTHHKESSAGLNVPMEDGVLATGNVRLFIASGLEVIPVEAPLKIFEILDAGAGLSFEVNLMSFPGQVADTGYSSSYQLDVFGKLAAGKALDKLLKFLGAEALSFDKEISTTLQPSPTGTLVVPSSVTVGQAVDLRVDVNDGTVLGDSNVERIRIYKDTGAGLVLIAEAAGGTAESYTLQWTPQPEDISDSLVLIASLETFLLPMVELELGDDAAKTVEVLPAGTPGSGLLIMSTRDGDSAFDLFAVDVAGLGGVTRLTDFAAPQSAYDAVYSPDGTRIAFTVWGDLGGQLWVMDGDGANAKALSAADFDEIRGISWSPTSTQLVVKLTASGASTKTISVFDVIAETRDDLLTLDSYKPALWSATNRIAYENVDEVRAMDPDGTNDTLMFTAASIGATDVYPRTWTSDGSKLVVDTDVGCQLASEGAAPTAAPFPCDTGVHLAPDDSKITGIVGGTGSITVYDFATGTVTTVIDATDFPGAMSFQNSGNAGFSQDGSQLAIGVDLDGQRDVYVVNTDGTGTPVAVGTSAEIDVPSSGRPGAIWR